MVIGIIGENCVGKSTLALEIRRELGGEIVTGRDYLRLAKSESEAAALFREKLRQSVDEGTVIYIITQPELIGLLPEGAVKILVSADIDTIKKRFEARIGGNLPAPLAEMLEKRHGIFDGGEYDYRFDGVRGDMAALCALLRARG